MTFEHAAGPRGAELSRRGKRGTGWSARAPVRARALDADRAAHATPRGSKGVRVCSDAGPRSARPPRTSVVALSRHRDPDPRVRRPSLVTQCAALAHDARARGSAQRSSMRPKRHTASASAQVATNRPTIDVADGVEVEAGDPVPEAAVQARAARRATDSSSIVPMTSATATDRPVTVRL